MSARVAKIKPKPPTAYVIAGRDGAGKTTFAREFLPDFVKCREFLNADLIAAGLSPFAPERQNVRAGRLLLERVGELAERQEDFGLWLSSKSGCINGSNGKRRKRMEKPTENPLAKLVEAALRQVAKKVVKRAKASGTPVIIWEDEKIKRVEPRNISKTRKRTPEN